ncbi:MAG: glycosyl transferase [Dehalococcoidaceae bacterium]|nr:glycosyl transferase [Dehalococcoidaceae bacterium]|tara:strand:+ start:7059 stop:8096 length:1038 start_codon:yes stop_codon:yes gene_type:complete
MTEPLVSIIVLNYNAGKLLIDCVDSLMKSTYQNLEIIIVDNISSDNSHIECKKKFSEIKLIENMSNLGYCGGNNVGIREAKGEFIMILNPDTIIEPNSINELVSAYEKNGEGLYQPKILSLNEKEIIQSTGNMIHVFGFGFARDKGTKISNKQEKIEKIGYASGTCLFTSKKIFEKVGLLDEFLFLYHDDLDFGWRAAQIGIDSYYIPTSKIYHVESYSLKWSEKKFYWLERNRKYCIKTHYSKETYEKMSFSLFLVDLFVWGFYFSKGFLGAKIRAELDIKRNKKIIEEKYSELEKRKIVSDNELIKMFPDKIFVPTNVSQQGMNKTFNSILTKLSKNFKEKII